MGRFHYWLGTSQVTKLRLVLHRLPNSIFYLSFTLYFAAE
jgi:hypothetical protein